MFLDLGFRVGASELCRPFRLLRQGLDTGIYREALYQVSRGFDYSSCGGGGGGGGGRGGGGGGEVDDHNDVRQFGFMV